MGLVKSPSQLWWQIRVWALVSLTFFPFFGIGIGNNTNIPLSSLAAILLIDVVLQQPLLVAGFVLVMSGPAALGLINAATGLAILNSASMIVWPFDLAPLFGFAAIAMRCPKDLLMPVRLGVVFTALYAVIQRAFLESGVIPLLGYYNLPGYASVSSNAEVIVTYIKRPFAFFPEPSFMAGSLALAVATLVLVRYQLTSGLSRIDVSVILTGVAAIYFSDSGSGLASIGLVLFIAVWPAVKGLRRLFLALGAGAISIWLGSAVLGSRGLDHNSSWSDRLASIIGALRYVVTSDGTALFGAGRGASAGLFQRGVIPLDGLQYFTPIPDVFSVMARLLLEEGLIFGIILLVILMAIIFLAAKGTSGKVVASVYVVIWILVAGLTISYESAAWIWAFPGVGIGLLVTHYSGLQGSPSVSDSIYSGGFR